MDVERIAGPSWAGWRFHRGELFAPEWRRGITPGEIRALPYLMALDGDLERRRRELEELKRELAGVARLAGWYRRQLVLEARLGLMLRSLAG